MPSIEILPSAEDDLDALYETDEDSAAEIETALDEIESDPILLEKLCRTGTFNLSRPNIDTKKVAIYQNSRRNVLRLKFWDWQGSLVPYRALYAYHPQRDTYYVLAIAPRGFVYDPEHELTQRVLADFDKLDIRYY